MKKDTVFTNQEYNTGFKFDKNVVDVFDDMLIRSIPFYVEFQNIIINLAHKYHQKGTNIYDLGCSLGSTCFNLSGLLEDNEHTSIIGIDYSSEMIDEANTRLAQKPQFAKRIKFICKDLTEFQDFINPSIIISNLTLQFIEKDKRRAILKTVHEKLNDNGIFIFTEKVKHDNPFIHNLFIEQYHDYKRHNGYSEAEIENKRIALENVLMPHTIDENINLLNEAGLKTASTIFQWYNFTCFLAKKK